MLAYLRHTVKELHGFLATKFLTADKLLELMLL